MYCVAWRVICILMGRGRVTMWLCLCVFVCVSNRLVSHSNVFAKGFASKAAFTVQVDGKEVCGGSSCSEWLYVQPTTVTSWFPDSCQGPCHARI